MFHPFYETMWVAISAIGQWIAAILAFLALLYSLKTFRTAQKAAHYGELDKVYMDLLRMALDRPYLVNAAARRTKTQKAEYGLYAFMVWNFVETISDRCHRDDDLWKTWRPVVETENRLHRDWFDEPRNHHKFKPQFRQFMQEKWPRMPASLTPAP